MPLGLAAALVVAGTITAWPAIAPATVTVVAVGAVAGLVFAWPVRRLSPWPVLAAVAVLLAYGAPVLLSGQATFLGVVKLDDTATWFNIIDNVISHGRSVAGLPPSTYTLNFGQANPAYPLGAFMLPGVARGLTGVDIAWVFQPYMACCRGGAFAVPVCAHAAAGRLAADAGAAGIRGSPVGAAVWLQPVGRDQGGDRGVSAGAGSGARGGRPAARSGALARADPAGGHRRGADPDAGGRRGRLGGAGAGGGGADVAVRGRQGRAPASQRRLDRVAVRADGGVRRARCGQCWPAS